MNFFKKHDLYNFFTIIIFVSLLILFPLNSSNIDMWDGVFLSYASEINNFDGVKNHFFEASWYNQYYLSLIVNIISKYLEIPFFKISIILSCFFLILIFNEIIIFAQKELGFLKVDTFILIAFLSSFNIWHILLTSTLLAHILYFFLCLLSLRIIYSNKFVFSFFGYFIFYVSLELNSLLVFSICMAYVYEANRFKKLIFFPSKKTFIIGILALIFYILRSTINAPYGAFENYNSIIIPLNISDIYNLIRDLIFYLFFLIPLIIAILFFIILTFSLKLKNKFDIKYLINKNSIFLLVLFFGSCFPYILVGKNPGYFGFYDWSARQAILLSMPITLISTSVFSIIYKNYFLPNKMKSSLLSMISFFLILFILQLTMLWTSIGLKLNRQIFEKDFTNYFIENNIELRPGINELVFLDDQPSPRYRFYELNYIFFRIYQRDDWWSQTNNNYNVNKIKIPEISKNKKYSKWHIFNYEIQNICYNSIKINSSGYFGIRNIVPKQEKKINISIDESC